MPEQKRWSKLTRWATAGMLSFSILLGNVFPVHAETAAPAAPQISQWSVKTLHEGEKYGIYPINWYYDGSFQKAITPDKLKTLMEGTATKLDKLGFKKKVASLSFPTDKVITRETVITSLHKLLANYELPKAFDMDADMEPIDYLQKKGIVKGTKAGLELDKPSTVEHAAVMASRLVEFAYDVAGVGAEGLMWKVTNDKNTLYLLGSVHLGLTDMYPMQKSIREAFDASDNLWVELDMLNGDMSYFNEKMQYSDGTTIKDHVSKETYEKLQKALTKLDLQGNAFDGFKPFAISTSLSTLGYAQNPEAYQMAMLTGIDNYFITKAMLTGKPIHELEGIKLQADLFANVPPAQQEKELNAMLDSILTGNGIKESEESLKKMQLDWIEGDAEGLAKLLEIGFEDEASKRLIGERDKNMALKLAKLLEKEGENTSFVVVGAAHYVTKGMVVDLLKEKGYTVQYLQ
ncbi:TraB/GumN family protein [Paenibacillus agilis]|uniref:TraB/GumN family protein n=1 Tax=Paenibacillus agilis TaxID=3020863 RepID=A0A559J3Z8_9BACL|nr:TraB/GumN family protein [Paenibacillus agilis]TVX94581.1 TraB/GumN family protein [Paenibacillus agilis]